MNGVPVTAVDGADLSSETSTAGASAFTVVSTWSFELTGLLSAPRPLAVAELVFVPGDVALTTNDDGLETPVPMVPSVQETESPAATQPLSERTNSIPAGRSSSTRTSLTITSPTFWTVSVYVNSAPTVASAGASFWSRIPVVGSVTVNVSVSETGSALSAATVTLFVTAPAPAATNARSTIVPLSAGISPSAQTTTGVSAGMPYSPVHASATQPSGSSPLMVVPVGTTSTRTTPTAASGPLLSTKISYSMGWPGTARAGPTLSTVREVLATSAAAMMALAPLSVAGGASVDDSDDVSSAPVAAPPIISAATNPPTITGASRASPNSPNLRLPSRIPNLPKSLPHRPPGRSAWAQKRGLTEVRTVCDAVQ